MIRIWRYIRGYHRLILTGASPDWMLNRLSKQRIPFWDIVWINPFTVGICVFHRDLPCVEDAAVKAGCQLEHVSRNGIVVPICRLRHRWFLWLPLILCLTTMIYMQSHICFYTVTGNVDISDQAILHELENLGIGVGSYGPDIQPQWVEDHMLNQLHALQWITIYQTGCKAEVIVRERAEKPEVRDRKGFSNIIAVRPCILLEQSVWSGQALKVPGDVVAAGELLVSGVVDLDKTYLLTHAQAEIYGRTWWNTDTVIPVHTRQKGCIEEEKTSVWLEIGKRRIKIFGNSGISTAVCDKMISRKILSLPGNHPLPFSVCVETTIQRKLSQTSMNEMWAEVLLSDAATRTVMSQMIAGQILQRSEMLSEQNGLWHLTTSMECREMVARVAEPSWIKED